MNWLKRILRRRAKRTEYPNLYAQLANMRVCFDIRKASDDELIMLWLNTTMLVTALLAEIEERGMDANALLDDTQHHIDAGRITNHPNG